MNGYGLSTVAKIQNSLGCHDWGRVALFTCLMAACLAATSVPALAQSYTITDLGAVPANCLGDCSQGYSINNNGQVTGYNNQHGDAGFLTSPPYSNPIDLGSLGGGLTFGLGINSKGQVTGYSYPPGNNYHAFRISPPYISMTDLGTFGGGLSSGQGINDSGQIAGSSFLASRFWHAFFWDGTLHDIGTLGGNNSFGNGINASGQITGSADKARGVTTGVVTDAFLYTPAKGSLPSSMIDLGDLGGGGSEGLAINNSGQVTGDAYIPLGPQNVLIRHAFLWDGTMHDLGALGGCGNIFGRAINNLGQVAGYCDANARAFLYTPGTGMVELNTLLPSGSGWTLLSANSINDAGQITGQGINPSGAHHAFVLTPPLTPPPGGATISGSAVGKPASGTADAVFTATVNNTTNGPLTMNFNTADGTAVAGIDYAATAGTLTFLPGSTAQTVQTQIIGGPQNSSSLFYSVQLRSAGNGNLLASGAGAILTTVPPPRIAFTLSASPRSLAMIASSSKSSDITLRSTNGISGTAQLTAAWDGTAPTGVTFALLSSGLSIPPASSDVASTTLTVTTSSTPSPGTFTLRLTAATPGGVTRSADISIDIAATQPASTCGCTATGPFKDPRVKGLVAPASSGDGPGGFATVTGNLNQLTLTRNSPDHKLIIDSATKVSAFGFSPSGKLFVLITQPVPLHFSLDLYSVTTGGRLGTSSPLVTNPLSWGFSPDAENKFFIVTNSDNLTTHVNLDIYDTSTGKIVMPFSLPTIASVGNPEWTNEDDVEHNDSDDSGNKQAGGWGFSPDGNTFLVSYKTGANSFFFSLRNLTHTTAAELLEDTSHNVAGFWQFSPCSDLFMQVNQLGANPATTESVLFYYTSNGRLFKQANLEPSEGAPSASVTTQSDGSKTIQLVGVSLATIPSPQCSISGTMHSPANIALIDQHGNKTGFDSASNTAVNQIPGGTYTGIGSEPQTVAVPYIPGPYLIDAVGLSSLTSPQPYTLTIAARDGSGDVFDSVDLSGMASAGSDRRIGFIVGNGPIQPQDATPACSTDVSGHVSIQRSGLTPKYGKVGMANVQIGYLQTLTLTNTAGTAINGPIEVAFGSLPSAVSVAYSNGTAAQTVSCNVPAGAPYLTLPAGSLAPNTPVQLVVLFLDSIKTPFSGYTTRVLAGANP